MWHSRMLWLLGAAAFPGSGHGFMNLGNKEAMKILAMNLRFDNDYIQDTQKHELFKHAGYNDYELYINKAISKDQYVESVKKTFKDEIIESLMEQGGIDIGQPLWRKMFFEESDAKIFSEMVGVQEPLKSILRLMRSDEDDEAEYGKELFKKYQFKQFNDPNGGALAANMDHFMLEDSAGRKKIIKEIMHEEWFKGIEDPLQRAILKLWAKSRDETDATAKAKIKENIKDLQYIQLFESSLPETTPVSQEDLYMFYKMTDGRIAASDLLNVAFGDQIGPINKQDFEHYFGSNAQEFTCRAHEASMMVQCGINLKPDECAKEGCCWLSEDKVTGEKGECYQNLFGRIGSSVARRLLVDNNDDMRSQIEELFPMFEIPPLDLILRDSETPYGVELWYDDNPAATDGYEKLDEINSVKYEGYNWWEHATLEGPTYFKNGPNGEREAVILNQKQDRPSYGRPGYQWKEHGATASPIFQKIPGLNPTANPIQNGLDPLSDYYKMWLEYASQQDQAQCALIPKASRVTCMRNYEALTDYVNAGGPTKCEEAGCCFSEESFLKGDDACYRAIDYGTCTYVPSDYKRTECGLDGITQTQCLTNPRCCYQPSQEPGVPWCHFKVSATLEGKEGWCEAWSDKKLRHIERPACFFTTKSNLFNDDEASNINNLVKREQCESAGCCYDDSLDLKEIEFLKDGLGLTQGPTRCFKKSNPYIEQTINGESYGGQPKNDDGKIVGANIDLDTDYWVDSDGDEIYVDTGEPKIPPAEWGNQWAPYLFRDVKTCDVRQWRPEHVFKRSCGENLSYYQCVYVNKCCYAPSFNNQPSCYRPEVQR